MRENRCLASHCPHLEAPVFRHDRKPQAKSLLWGFVSYQMLIGWAAKCSASGCDFAQPHSRYEQVPSQPLSCWNPQRISIKLNSCLVIASRHSKCPILITIAITMFDDYDARLRQNGRYFGRESVIGNGNEIIEVFGQDVVR